LKYKFSIILIGIFITFFAWGQNQKKIYYDENWIGCSETEASFYRLVEFDSNNKPIGVIRDYFITGEIQAVIEGALYIDKQNNDGSLFNGLELGFYKNGNKEYERTYSNGEHEGLATYWDKDENILIELNYSNGQLEGISTSWYENGNKESEENYSNGELEGVATDWYENGNKLKERNFSSGELEGVATCWYENGNKEYEANYSNGEHEGLATYWYENGNKEYEANYSNGEHEGLATYWDKDGNKLKESNYSNRGQEKLATYWDKDRNKVREENYSNGKQEGLATYWNKDGNKAREENYSNGKQEGLATYWNKDGNKAREENYSEGKQVGLATYWYENGNKFMERNFSNGQLEGLCIVWDENGNKGMEENYSNGKKEGLTTYWYENRNKMVELNYSNGQLEGISTSWYENGNKESEENHSNDQKNGLATYWYENGNKKYEKKYSNGKLEGKFIIEYDEFGSCQKVFHEDFVLKENINNWPLVSTEENNNSSIITKEGLLMENKTGNTFIQTLNIPLNLDDDFSIETIVDFKSGEVTSGHGLIWGYKDYDNYCYFYISAAGFYKIGMKHKGINLKLVDWIKSDYISQNYQRNKLLLLRAGDIIYFSINGNLVHTDNFYPFAGNNIGFSIPLGKIKVLFEYLIVKQDVNNTLVDNNILNKKDDKWTGNGTGFFVSTDGYIVTNYHVISEATDIEIEFLRNGKEQNYKAKIMQSDKLNDLALLKINDSTFHSFNLIPYNFQTSLSDVGSSVFTLGYPMALSVMGTEIKFTDGKISSKTGYQNDITTYQMTTPIQKGNSGGPLFDYDGNLIGIVSSLISSSFAENVSYAIKSSYLKNLIDVLPKTLILPNDKAIMDKTLTEKIKILSDFVVLIKIN